MKIMKKAFRTLAVLMIICVAVFAVSCVTAASFIRAADGGNENQFRNFIRQSSIVSSMKNVVEFIRDFLPATVRSSESGAKTVGSLNRYGTI